MLTSVKHLAAVMSYILIPLRKGNNIEDIEILDYFYLDLEYSIGCKDSI